MKSIMVIPMKPANAVPGAVCHGVMTERNSVRRCWMNAICVYSRTPSASLLLFNTAEEHGSAQLSRASRSHDREEEHAEVLPPEVGQPVARCRDDGDERDDAQGEPQSEPAVAASGKRMENPFAAQG